MHRALAGIWAPAALGIAVAGCAPARKPPGAPPTPATITRANPGGDAADPEGAALERLDAAAWGVRRDHYNTLLVPLTDAREWTRVKLWGYPTRVAYRFGDEHYGVVAVWYQRAEGPDDPSSCLARFIDAGRPLLEAYGVRATETERIDTVTARSRRPMIIHVVDASVDALFGSSQYAGALAAYASWPGRCLIQGFVVVATSHGDLARRIRDRWVAEGAPRLSWMPRVIDAPTIDAR